MLGIRPVQGGSLEQLWGHSVGTKQWFCRGNAFLARNQCIHDSGGVQTEFAWRYGMGHQRRYDELHTFEDRWYTKLFHGYHTSSYELCRRGVTKTLSYLGSSAYGTWRAKFLALPPSLPLWPDRSAFRIINLFCSELCFQFTSRKAYICELAVRPWRRFNR